MSGIYAVLGELQREPQDLASLLSAQVSSGTETLRSFARSHQALLGISTHDHLRKGPMPVFVEPSALWVLMEGTLYPDGAAMARSRLGRSEAETDAALFAALYRRGLLEMALPGLNGAFFVVLWDPREKLLVACNDRFGLYPNYWSDNGRTFCLGGRVLCSVLARSAPGEWNPRGVAQLLTTGDYAGDETAVAEVECFPQASIMRKREGRRPDFHRYWSYDYRSAAEGVAAEERAAEIGEALLASVGNQASAPCRVGVTLSGGLDSRSLAVALSELGLPVRTFSYGVPGCLDRSISRNVARRIGSRHRECDYQFARFDELFEALGETTEGMSSLVDANMLPHIDIFARDADLILNGYAADLLLGGSYLRSRWMGRLPPDTLARRLFGWRNKLLPEGDLGLALSKSLAPLGPEQLPSALYRELLGSCACERTPDTVDRFFLENRVRRTTSMGTVIMRRNVESAACFFGYGLIDLITGAPAAMRLDHRLYLLMMKAALPKATRERWQRTLLPPTAPVPVAMASKAILKGLRLGEAAFGIRTIASGQSFSDFEGWFRGPLKDFVGRACGEGFPVADEVLDPEFCRRTLLAHLEGRKSATELLGSIVSIKSFSLALGKARSGKAPRAMPVSELEVNLSA